MLHLLTAALLAAAPAPEPDKPVELPKRPQPFHAVARTDGNGNILLQQIAAVPIAETRAEKRVKDGKEVVQYVTVTRYAYQTIEQRLQARHVEGYTANGKKIDAKKLADRLAKPTHAVVAMDGKPVDPFYLKVLKPDTLVLVVSAPPAVESRPKLPPQPLPKKD